MTKKLNICLMNDSFPPTVDGVATCVANYASVIENGLGHAMVCTPYYPNVLDNYSYPVIRYPSFNTQKTIGYRAGYPFDTPTLDKLREMPIDVIHAHCPIMSTLMARTLRESIHKPLILTYHTKFDIDIEKAVSLRSMQKTAIKLLIANVQACDEVWVVSKGAGENLRSLGYEGSYIIMQNGVDFQKGRADADSIHTINESYRLSPDENIFLFVGRMMWYKGIKTTLDGLRIAKTFGAKFKMLFVGDGPDKAEIIAYAKNLELDNECLFISAVHDREMLRALYSRALLFLFPSDFDTNGLVVREAAACGTASLVLDGSCAAEGISNERNGLLIKKDPADLARCVFNACSQPQMAVILGQRAMDEIYLSWDEAVKRAFERYEIVSDRYAQTTHIEYPIHRGDDFFRFMAYVCTKKKHKKPIKKRMYKPLKHKVYKIKKKTHKTL